jgi:solute carrier family 25 protein 14/30
MLPQENLYSNIACAVVAGMSSSALANPTDVLKVRMQTAATASNTTIYNAFRKIYKFEGVKGLWRVSEQNILCNSYKANQLLFLNQGVGPTSQRAGIIAGVELPVYDFTKRYLIDHAILADSFPNHLV